MSSDGEIRLREKVLQGLLEANAIGDPDQLLYYVDAVIHALKQDDYFVHCGTIYTVGWDNPVDWHDDGIIWSIKTEDYNSDDEYEDEDYDD